MAERARAMWWGALLVVNAVLVVAVWRYFQITVPRSDVTVLPGARGPVDTTRVPQPVATSWRRYHVGTTSRLAILLTDTTTSWLGLAHGLKSIGVPFTITTDVGEALRHHIVLVYPVISGSVLGPDALAALKAYPRNGGTLVALNVLGGGLNETFGFREAIPSRTHRTFNFGSAAIKLLALSDERETTIRLAAAHGGPGFGVYEYSNTAEPPFATYEDGTAAITQRSYGAGHAYALGVDIGALALLGYNHRDERLSRSFANEYEPTIDVFLRLLKALYRGAEPDAVTLGTVPNGKSLMVAITHDIDYTPSFANALVYAAFERAHRIPATYFIQAKYINDSDDRGYLTPRSLDILHTLDTLGMELASHSVSHSRGFSGFPLGSGFEAYPDYLPIVRGATTTYNGTILGELRVSKFIVERFSSHPVESFRPGGLSNPFRLPESLEATGYRYSSSTTANISLTHLPFQLNYGRGYESETTIFEFPITVEDGLEPKLGDRLAQAVTLAEQIGRTGGSVVVLIHPDILDHKLAFEQGFVAAVQDAAWFGTVSDCGRWWSARNEVAVDVQSRNGGATVTVTAPKRLTGLTLQLPPGSRLVDGDAHRGKGQGVGVDGRLILPEIHGTIRLHFRGATGGTASSRPGPRAGVSDETRDDAARVSRAAQSDSQRQRP